MINEFMVIYLLINLCNTHNYCIVICQKWRQQDGVHFDNSLQEYLNCRLRWLKGSSLGWFPVLSFREPTLDGGKFDKTLNRIRN